MKEKLQKSSVKYKESLGKIFSVENPKRVLVNKKQRKEELFKTVIVRAILSKALNKAP